MSAHTDLGLLRHAVENALYDYAAAADDLEIEALATMFADATVTFGAEVAAGEARVGALYRRRFENAPRVRHLLSNVRLRDLEIEGDVTLVRADCRYVRVAYADGAVVLSLGDYSARFDVGESAAVRFLSFEVTSLWAAS